MSRYLKVWFLLSIATFQSFFVSRIGAGLFLLGKIIKFLFFGLFLIMLLSKTKVLAGYNFWQIILFYLTFNLIDSATQMLFRKVYRFREQIVSGSFDLTLVKPVNSLFSSLLGWTDILDFVTLFPLAAMIIFVILKIPEINFVRLIYYLILIINGLLIATAFHIIVLSLAILTTEIDHTIMIYRDFTGMGKIPVNIYAEPLRSFLTFVIPVGIMMNFPVDALIGTLSITGILIAISVCIVLLGVSLLMWNYALRCYTSASS